MKVILNEDIKNLGEEGDICVVKNGYARNFLLPKGLVVPCTKGNLKVLDQKKDAIEQRKQEKREAAKSEKEKIEQLSLNLKVPAGDTGKLFGSVNNATLSNALAAEGILVERKKIEVVGTHVKMVGNYTARVKLYGDEVATLKFTVEGQQVESGKKTSSNKESGNKEAVESKSEPVEANSVVAEEESAAESNAEVAENEL